MKVLFDHRNPFILAHGGFQIQIEQTKAALENVGVEVEWLRWWDADQKGDIIHHFGRPPGSYIAFAQGKGMKVIFSYLLSGAGARAPFLLWMERKCIGIARRTLPNFITSPFAWDAYSKADACVAITPWEAHLMTYLFDAPPSKVHVVPNGVEDVFLNSTPADRGRWLVCTSTITPIKRVLELAEAAVLARVPVWIIGRPYSDSDPYAQRFFQLAKNHPQFVRYEGAVQDRTKLAQIYREARGFVLLSTHESLSISALEAAACECPLMLSSLPWAKSTFSEQVYYCPISSPEKTAQHLKRFYDDAPSRTAPNRPATWRDIGRSLKSIYDRL